MTSGTTDPAITTPSRAELERAIARGRRLHGEAVRAAFRGFFTRTFAVRSWRHAGLGVKDQFC